MHILVIEDDKNLNQGICFAIQKEGYQVSCAHSLGETAEILKKEDIGLLILDLNLPDGDGIEFCQEFRRTSKVPVIMLTARDMETDEVRGLESGADDYLTKPFSLAVLKARIANAIRHNAKAEIPQELSCGEFVLDIKTMKVTQNRVELNLTLTEYKLLSYFLNHTGQVLTKEQILQAVWDVDSNFVDENTLAVNIRRLRTKIGTKGEDDAIRTVFGVGYQFITERR